MMTPSTRFITSQFAQAWSRLTEPLLTVSDSEQRQVSRALSAVLLAFLASILLLYIVRLPVHDGFDVEVASQVTVGLFGMVGYWLTRRGYYRQVSMGFVVGCSLTVFVVASLEPITVGLFVFNHLATILVFSSLFLSLRWTVATFAMQLVGMLVWAAVLPGVTLGQVIAGPFSFVLVLGLVVVVVAYYRSELEKHRQAQLAASEARFRILIEQAPIAITIARQSRLIYANPAYVAMHGFTSQDELIGMPVVDRVAPESRPSSLDRAQRRAQGLPVETRYEYLGLRKDGTVFPVIAGVARVNLDDGPANIGFFQDITERGRMERALQESEERYRRLIETSPDGIFVHQDGRFVFSNPAGLILLGAAHPDDLIGQRVIDFVDAAYQPVVIERLQTLAQAQQTVTWIEEKLVRLDSTRIDVEVAASSVMLNGILSVQVVARDITEHKRAEANIRSSEARYRAISELISDYAFSYHVEPDGMMVREWVTDSYTRLTGYAVGEIDNRGAYTLYVPEEQTRVEADVAAVMKGKPVHGEYRIITKSGEERWIHIFRQPVWDDQENRVVRFYGVAQDITDRKRAEDTLRESERKYRLLFEHMMAGFALHEMIYDAQGNPTDYRYLEVNPAFEKLTGLSASSVLGQTVKTVLPTTEAYWIELYGKVAQTGEPVAFQNYAQDLGKHFDVWAFSPRQGQFAVIFMDISERKQAEQQAFELALERQRVKVLETFIQDASHDLRTPLSVVQLSTQTLHRLTDRLSQQTQHISQHYTVMTREQMRSVCAEIEEVFVPIYQRIDYLENSAERLTYLVSSMLEITQLQHQPNLRRAPQNLNRLVSDATVGCQDLITEQNQTLQFIPDDTLPKLILDADLFSRVIYNLLTNAAQYTPQHGTITIRTYQQDRLAVLEVSDTGVGIAQDHLPHIFERFYRVDKARSTDKGGAGLGLAIVKHIVEAHGGRIEVTSQPEQGSAFRVFLPLED